MKSSSKSGLSQRMLPACSPLVTGLKSPPQSALSNSLQLSMPHSVSKVSEHNARSPVRPVYNSYRDGAASKVAAALAGAYSSSEPSEAAVVATLAYARMQPEQGFPYGISGVAMPSYNYGSELYNYASNGFPRKSRICSYCSKVFTRSTTRRYHEKRCPLLRAAGSLAKGDTSSTGIAATAGAGIGGDDGVSPGGSNVNIPSQHPPLLTTLNRESPSPLQTSSATSSASTSAVVPASSSAHSLNPSLYSAYVSQSMYSNVPVTSTSSAPHLSPVIVAGNSSVDQNRNSLLSAKQEAGQLVNNNHQAAGAAPESTVVASPVRDVDSVHTRVQTRVEYGQHFSPLSTASLSPSIGSPSVEDEAESDAAEDLTVRPSMLMYSSPPVVSNGAHAGINSTSGKPFFLKDYTYDNPSHPTSQESYKLVWGSQAGHLPSLADKADLTGKSTDIPSDEDGSSVRDEKGSSRYDCDTVAQGVDYGSCRMDVDEADPAIQSEKECGICQQQFQSSRSLHAHMQLHQKYNPNACRICGQRFLRTSMRMAHERIHSVENPFYCVVCGLHFARKFALRQHVIRQHVNAKDRAPLACRHCQKSAMSLVHLLQHLLTHSIPKHERTSLLYLRFARPVFSPHKEEALEMAPPRSVDSRISDDSPGALLSEPPPLIQVRRSPVSVAGSEESVLTNGTSTASGARDMEWCRLCDKEYPKSFMRFHEKAHADQKPYECPTCKKRFGYKNNMKSHMKLHAGIKPYQCHICGAKFTRGSTLRRHARRHGINTETIWDLFVSKGQASRQGSLASRAVALNQAQAHDAPSSQGQGQAAALPPSAEVMTTGATPSRTLKPESSVASAGSCDILPSGKSFDMTGFSPSPTLAQNLFASYQGLPAVTQSLYQPYMATAQFLNYAAGFSSVNVQEVQSDALNLSLPDKHRRSTSGSGSSTQDQTPSGVNHSQGPVYHSTTPTDGGSLSCHDLIPDDDDNEKRSTKMEQSMAIESRHADSDMGSSGASAVLSQVAPEVRDSLGSIKPLCRSTSKDCGVQVTLCCGRITPAGGSSMEDFSSTLGSSNGPLDMSATSPSRPVAAATDSFQHETIAMLMSAGRLFRCPYCDCYFTEYAMYHVHQKLHQPDQPFTCRTCGENCHDRVYFSLHICDHLR